MAMRIGELLVSKNLITQDQLEQALAEQSKTGKFLGELLIEMAFVLEEDLLGALASQFNTRFVSLENVQVNPAVIKLVPRAMVWEYRFMPIEMRSAVILIAVSNPLDMWPMSAVKDKLSLSEVQIVLAKKEDIEATILKYYGPDRGDA